MALDPRPVIKAGSLTNLTDARYFASFGVEMIGFHFDPYAENYLPADLAAEIRGWLYGPRFVGEFRGVSKSDQAIADFVSTVEKVKLEVVECTPEDLAVVKSNWEGPIILALNAEQIATAATAVNDPQVDYVLLQVEDAQAAVAMAQLGDTKPVLLDSAHTVEGLSEMLPKAQPAGFNVRGGAEQQVGMKTFELLDPLMIYLVGDPS